jgi:hypothetical protein
MTTRAELDVEARGLGIDPDEFSKKVEVAAAIDAVKAVEADNAPDPDADPAPEPTVEPQPDPIYEVNPEDFDLEKAKKGTVLFPLTHDGVITPVGAQVPSDLSDEAIATLVRQGHVAA